MSSLMKDAPPSGEASFEDLLSGASCLITSGVVVRRELVVEAGLFDEALRNAQDYDLWLRLARRKARLAYHDEVLLRYRGRSDGLSGDAVNILLRELRVFDKIERSYPLAPEEREGILGLIRERRAELEFELGKINLLNGDFTGARDSFARSDGFAPHWKPRLAFGLMIAAPRFLRALYARRMEGPRTRARVSPQAFGEFLDPEAVRPSLAANAAPKVSVIIPAYNAASFIAETLDSVFAQTFADYEVIVINDGSPDTAELERALAPYLARLRYLKQENRGVSAARNAGLKAARGELVAFLDADDLWLPNYLNRQLGIIRDRGCDLVCANALFFGETKDSGLTYMDVLEADSPWIGDATFLELLTAERSLITSGIVARRKLLFDAGLFDETLRNAEDLDLWLRLAKNEARLTFHHEVLLRYRVRSDSLSGGPIELNLRELRIFDKVERSYEFPPEEREAVLAAIRERRAVLEFEIGKLRLLDGAFPEARAAFSNAVEHGGGLKPRIALGLTLAAPRLVRALYARRVSWKRA
jgi:glycosyltransferase involved in cell wall biosynthesis